MWKAINCLLHTKGNCKYHIVLLQNTGGNNFMVTIEWKEENIKEVM